MSGFSIDWLNLREPADQCSRNPELLQQAVQWLFSHKSMADQSTVMDLGAGTGSTLRAFLASDTDQIRSVNWRLVDNDSNLLDVAKQRHGDSLQIETFSLDLNNVFALPFEGVQLITASALFDLVSEEFIQAIVDQLRQLNRQQAVGLYVALSYDGIMQWSPHHPFDTEVQAGLNRDQKRDKGFGLALGPDASKYLEQTLSNAGFLVTSVNSPWMLTKSDEGLIVEFIQGIAGTLTKDPAIDGAELQRWVQFRLNHVTTGTCKVGHKDLLALPTPGD